ncbi:MAG: hypothetical protein LBB88_11150 [Planctomycetaceae bacterium]|nr:hypothetical protein [Planctomycetaceae bacterium]
MFATVSVRLFYSPTFVFSVNCAVLPLPVLTFSQCRILQKLRQIKSNYRHGTLKPLASEFSIKTDNLPNGKITCQLFNRLIHHASCINIANKVFLNAKENIQ